MSKRIIWLVENCFSEDMGPIVQSLKELDQEVHVVKPQPFTSGEQIIPAGSEDAKIMTLGSIQLLYKLNRFLPGGAGWADFKKFDCLTYYGYFGENLLNSNYYIYPLNDLERRLSKLWNVYGGQVFIRPTSGTKTFPSGIYTPETLKSIYDSLWNQDQHIPVLISPAQKIKNEYRFFIAKDHVVDGSQYRDESGRYSVVPLEGRIANQARAFANQVLKECIWRPEPMFVMDVCVTQEGFKVVELNSFSCSGWYATPPEWVLRKAIEIYSNEE